MKNLEKITQIVDGGYCIGCGACAAATHGRIEMVEDAYLQYQAKAPAAMDSSEMASALAVCPFSNSGLNEDQISEKVFDQEKGQVGDVIGYYQSLYAGHVSDKGLREKCTSGGIITWILTQLLERGLVDAVIHIKRCTRPGTLFEYGISRTSEEVLAGAKSRYYPIEISQVMEFVRQNEGRYVFIGLPCFNKAVRNLCLHDSVLNKRILYFVGLVCGHLKSKAFAGLFSWQAGIPPDQLADIDFRVKMKGRPANQYGVQLTDQLGNIKVLQSKECYGSNWGYNFFKYEACDYCDDVFAETADMVVGDAWLQGYISESHGNSIIVTRNADLESILTEAIDDGRLELDALSAKNVCDSQSGGIRHRREGLKYRLYLKNRHGVWVPKKRVPSTDRELLLIRKIIFRFRMYLRKKSSELWIQAVRQKDFQVLVRGTKWQLMIYDNLLKATRYYQRRMFTIKHFLQTNRDKRSNKRQKIAC